MDLFQLLYDNVESTVFDRTDHIIRPMLAIAYDDTCMRQEVDVNRLDIWELFDGMSDRACAGRASHSSDSKGGLEEFR